MVGREPAYRQAGLRLALKTENNSHYKPVAPTGHYNFSMPAYEMQMVLKVKSKKQKVRYWWAPPQPSPFERAFCNYLRYLISTKLMPVHY